MVAALLDRLAPYKLLAMLALVGTLAMAVFVQMMRLDAERATSAGRLSTIRAFEASTAALRADAALREKTAKQASQVAARQAANAQRQIESIQSASVPEDCAGAIGWLVERGRELEGQP